MKVNKFLVALWCVVAMALSASSASAITITLSAFHDYGVGGFTVNGPHPDLSGIWDLTEDDDWDLYIDPATSLAGWNILSVQVDFVIIGDNTSSNPSQQSMDRVQFFLETPPGVLFWSDTTGELDWSQEWTSALGSGTLFASISADGILEYRVHETAGTFAVQSAALTVVADNPNISLAVPDGGTTLTMLGLGMVGLGALRRRFGA